METTTSSAARNASSPSPNEEVVQMVEWGASSYFSFLEGCSSPSQLIAASLDRGYLGLGLADRMGLYGCVEALRAVDALRTAEALRAPETQRAPETHKEDFFYAPGIRLHFDHCDPLLIYPLCKKAHSLLCKYLSDWALEGIKMKDQEKGLPPIAWLNFYNFLSEHRLYLPKYFLIFAIPGRYFPWTKNSLKQFTRSQTQDVMRVAPTYALPPQMEGQTPLWLKQLSLLCGEGQSSALSLLWPLTLSPGIKELQTWLLKQSQSLNSPLCAISIHLFENDEQFELAQLVTSIRHRIPLKNLGLLAQVNSERRLLSNKERLWHKEIFQKLCEESEIMVACPFERSVQLKERHAFSLYELNYKYPIEKIPEGKTSAQHLRSLVMQRLFKRYPQEVPHNILLQIEHELQLIEKLEYEDYFLTIYEILDYARQEEILFQGRGSAANSAVCYALGITAIDPVKMDLLFERFLSQERNEPPDIDIDFEHERREEVLQEIYSRYGRHRAAMVANTIRFRGRMAMREAGKALELNEDELKQITTYMGREGRQIFKEEKGKSYVQQNYQKIFGSKISHLLPTLLRLSQQLVGLPRHMGLHSCGFVLAHGDLRHECILEPASKNLRSVIPWNKDDVDTLKWVKVDLLSLGMLTAIRKCFEDIGTQNTTGKKLTLSNIPQDCPHTYKAFQRADTVGVFQIESRAQMNMLPRLVPKNFYDIVVQVAIVRPGPLQGGMVHPYLRRRQGSEKVSYAHPRLEKVLAKTLGVPIFQEQIMKMAVAVADFTPGESEQMRKVMSSAWRSRSQMHKLHEKLMKGMLKNGITRDYAERIYQQMEAFGEYGFPESHSASFAILAYISGWLKVHHPAEFLCSLLNSQPMGFYSTRALIGDAQRHGVKVLAPNICFSKATSCVVNRAEKIVRFGLQHIHGLKESDMQIIEQLQRREFFKNRVSLRDLRTHLSMGALSKIVRAGAFTEIKKIANIKQEKQNRPQQIWSLLEVKNMHPQSVALIPSPSASSSALTLNDWSPWEALTKDYQHLGFSLREHPAHHARLNFFPLTHDWISAERLWDKQNREDIFGIGLLTVKQKPPTANGMCFLTLEDETGFMNLVIEPKTYLQVRRQIDTSPLIAFFGRVEKSKQINSQEKYSASLSIYVKKLWNPFETGV